jgi:hypothetical protein
VDKTLLVVKDDEDAEEEDVTDDVVRAVAKEDDVTEEDVVGAVVEDVCLIETYTPVIKMTMMITAATDIASALEIAGFPLFNHSEWLE